MRQHDIKLLITTLQKLRNSLLTKRMSFPLQYVSDLKLEIKPTCHVILIHIISEKCAAVLHKKNTHSSLCCLLCTSTDSPKPHTQSGCEHELSSGQLFNLPCDNGAEVLGQIPLWSVLSVRDRSLRPLANPDRETLPTPLG